MASPYRLLAPIFIIGCGFLFLLDTLGVSGLAWTVNIFWPGLLLAFGLENWNPGGRGRRIWSGLLLAAGAALWADNFDYLHLGLQRFWPLGLIAVGVCLVVRMEAD